MSLVDNGGMYMPVAPAGNGYGGNGMFGDGCFWLIVLFLFAFMGNGWGGMGAGNGAMPYMMNQNTGSEVQRGFDQQAVMGGIGALQGSITSLAQGQCQGFANAEIAANGRQMAGMQQNWAMQTDIGNRLDGIQMSQQAGLFENRAAIADVKYAIAQDGAATRSNTDAKTQAIMDKLCQLELDGVKQNYETRIAGMQAQMNAMQQQINNASRDVALANEVDALYNRLNSCPVPTTPVYGRTPIFTCGGQGCGCNGMNPVVA